MQEAGQTIDFDTYLLPPGKADVLFPTSFPQLERMYTHIARSKGAELCALLALLQPCSSAGAQHETMQAASFKLHSGPWTHEEHGCCMTCH